MVFKFIRKEKRNDLPITAGIYAFQSNKGVLLYIGKAINIKERVKNHFQQPTFKDNIFIPETEKIGYFATGSEIETLVLEADLIKKLQPKYNTDWKDNKNYFFVAITKEEFPRVFVTHQPEKQSNNSTIKQFNNNYIGPFVDGKALKQTLRILRRVFPFRTCRVLPKKVCLYYDLNLCPAPCQNNLKSKPSSRGLSTELSRGPQVEGNENLKTASKNLNLIKVKKEYNKNIKNLIAVLRGQKTTVLKKMRKEMSELSEKQSYEKAKTMRDQIMSLENIFLHSHIFEKETSKPINWPKIGKALQKILSVKNAITRIEGYDISNIQGQEATGSMVVFGSGKPNKTEYRKFHIHIEGKPNDTAMIKEVLSRRLKHKEWPMSQVMLIDGGRGQLNAAYSIIRELKSKPSSRAQVEGNENLKSVRITALAKRKNELYVEEHSKPVLLKNLPQDIANLILYIRDEAHRFAISYHKKLRTKRLLSK